LEHAPPVDGKVLHGQDGLGNAGFAVSELHHQHPADKIIYDIVRACPEEVTILCLGPLTNLARAFQRDPQVPSLVGQIIMMGGSVQCIGDVTAVAEFNMYFDPAGAQSIFRSHTTKTLIPLDVTRRVLFSIGLTDDIPDENSRAGTFLRRILPAAFWAHRQHIGIEGLYLHDAVALMAAMHPELFETRQMAGDVETSGELARGATFFDQRPVPSWRNNMDVAFDVDVPAVKDGILRGLQQAGRLTR
jgi:purine nucleosidase